MPATITYRSICPHAIGAPTPKTRWLLAAGVRMGTINGDTGRVHGPYRVPGDTGDHNGYGSHYPRLGYANGRDRRSPAQREADERALDAAERASA
jgi:hypothetical protein